MTEKKRKGVAYNKAKDYWVASIYSKGQNYHLGSYKEFDAAVSIREQAESHLKAGDLPEWYAEFRKQNIKSEPSSHPGVFKSEGKWAAAIYFQNKSYHLGLYADVEDAIKIREKAERYKESGDFLEWFEKWKTTKPKKIREPKERTYKAEISYNKSKYLLGIFDTRFEASKTVEEAKKHLDSDFLRWYKENINITSPPDPQKKQTRKNNIMLRHAILMHNQRNTDQRCSTIAKHTGLGVILLKKMLCLYVMRLHSTYRMGISLSGIMKISRNSIKEKTLIIPRAYVPSIINGDAARSLIIKDMRLAYLTP